MAKIDFVADETLIALIEGFAKVNGMDRSEAIRTLIAAGGSNLIMVDVQSKFDIFMQSINDKAIIDMKVNSIFQRDNFHCRRCNSPNELTIYHIDRDPLNLDWNNLITLCDRCADEVKEYVPKNRVRMDFIEWFYSIPKL